MALIETFYREAKFEVIDVISCLKKKFKKFSISLDEWTSLKNIRYLNINVHYCGDEYKEVKNLNLGMIKIEGKCGADTMLDLVSYRNKL